MSRKFYFPGDEQSEDAGSPSSATGSSVTSGSEGVTSPVTSDKPGNAVEEEISEDKE